MPTLKEDFSKRREEIDAIASGSSWQIQNDPILFAYHSFDTPEHDWNHSQAWWFTVKQVLRLIATMILLLYVNSVIVVTKSICHDTWGLVKLFNVYYKNKRAHVVSLLRRGRSLRWFPTPTS